MQLHLTGLTPLIQVYDISESVHFYCDLLGFEVVGASPVVDTPEGRFSHWMWLRHGTTEVMLNTAYDAGARPPQRDQARQAAHGDTILFIGCPDLDAMYEHLHAHDVSVDRPKTAPYGMKQLHVTDPDGYGICFQHPA
jgi:glyoxylase I family protein